jgi:hypothetical protein
LGNDRTYSQTRCDPGRSQAGARDREPSDFLPGGESRRLTYVPSYVSLIPIDRPSLQLLNSNRYGDARGALREIQERNNDIKKIEKTLTELAQMFNEMSMLVEQQDENIVAIETSAAQVNTDMEGGLKHTEEAVVKARKARRKKWWW